MNEPSVVTIFGIASFLVFLGYLGWFLFYAALGSWDWFYALVKASHKWVGHETFFSENPPHGVHSSGWWWYTSFKCQLCGLVRERDDVLHKNERCPRWKRQLKRGWKHYLKEPTLHNCEHFRVETCSTCGQKSNMLCSNSFHRRG